jgi:hypothetical protein
MSRDEKIVDFPKAAPEEQARRLQIEVERLARQSPTEWMFWLEGAAEKHGIASTKLKAMIEATPRFNREQVANSPASVGEFAGTQFGACSRAVLSLHAAVARLAETCWIRVVANREAGAYERPGTKPTPIQENAPTAVPVGGLEHHEILENASRRRG